MTVLMTILIVKKQALRNSCELLSLRLSRYFMGTLREPSREVTFREVKEPWRNESLREEPCERNLGGGNLVGRNLGGRNPGDRNLGGSGRNLWGRSLGERILGGSKLKEATLGD